MLARKLFAIVVVTTTACSDDPQGLDPGVGNDGGFEPSESCGPVAATDLDNDCATMADCPGFSTEDNVEPASCPNCPDSARFQVCEAGTCRRFDRTGSVKSGFIGNLAADGGATAIEVLLSPWTSEGRRVTCSELLRTCDVYEPTLNIVNTNRNAIPGRIKLGLSYPTLTQSPAGEDFILMVIVTSEIGGRGDVLTVGCVDGIDVVESSDPTEVNLVLEDVWPPRT